MERGLVFDRVAAEYDRVRPGYPEELIDAALAGAEIRRVLEVGCGTGQLTAALAARGLEVEAVEPGANLAARAQRRVPGLCLYAGRFEDVELPAGAFDAVFSATAFHWVDPDVGWTKAAALLRPGGRFALLTHVPVSDDDVRPAQQELARIYGENWSFRSEQAVLAEAASRRANISAVWESLTWAESRDEAASRFGETRIEARLLRYDLDAPALLALQRTTSTHLVLPPRTRRAGRARDRRPRRLAGRHLPHPAAGRARGRGAPITELRALARSRWLALRPSLLRVLQASVAAALAWWLARLIPHHPRPFFAPIAAVVAMGAAPGTRGRQALDLIAGVVLGIGIAAAIATAAGTGTWQIGVAAGLAMLAGILLNGRPVVVIQAAASAVLLIALHRAGAAPGRLIDALIGGGVAIAIAQVLFPIDPLKVVARVARERGDELADAIELVAAALRDGDADGARRALSRIEAADGSGLAQALEMGRGVVRRAPRRRSDRRGIEAYAEVAHELAASAADARALASGALRALRDDERVPKDAAAAAEALAAALRGSEVEAQTARARSAAACALAETPTLGLSVFAHAVDALADHADRAAAAVAAV